MEKEPKGKEPIQSNSEVNHRSLRYAIKARRGFFRQHHESLSLMDICRLIERDLFLESLTLDTHRLLVKQLVKEEVFGAAPCESQDMERSVGLTKKNADITISRHTVMEAIMRRMGYLENHASELTLESFPRMLERDLRLPTQAFDPYRHFIRIRLNKYFEAASHEKHSKRSEKRQKDRCIPQDQLNQKPKELGERKQFPVSKKNIVRLQTSMKESVCKFRLDGNDDTSIGDYVEKEHEHAKSILRPCLLSVPPACKEVEEVPKNARETSLLKELEQMPRKEAFSSYPCDKDAEGSSDGDSNND